MFLNFTENKEIELQSFKFTRLKNKNYFTENVTELKKSLRL